MQQLISDLRELKLSAMANSLEEQRQAPLNQTLSFEERLGLLIHAEITGRRNRKINRLLRSSELKPGIRIEDVECDEKRGLKTAEAGFATRKSVRPVSVPVGVPVPDRPVNAVLQSFRADIDFKRERATLSYGVVGIKVWIYRGKIFIPTTP